MLESLATMMQWPLPGDLSLQLEKYEQLGNKSRDTPESTHI
jgi:hypothetical protein